MTVFTFREVTEKCLAMKSLSLMLNFSKVEGWNDRNILDEFLHDEKSGGKWEPIRERKRANAKEKNCTRERASNNSNNSIRIAKKTL